MSALLSVKQHCSGVLYSMLNDSENSAVWHGVFLDHLQYQLMPIRVNRQYVQGLCDAALINAKYVWPSPKTPFAVF